MRGPDPRMAITDQRALSAGNPAGLCAFVANAEFIRERTASRPNSQPKDSPLLDPLRVLRGAWQFPYPIVSC